MTAIMIKARSGISDVQSLELRDDSASEKSSPQKKKFKKMYSILLIFRLDEGDQQYFPTIRKGSTLGPQAENKQGIIRSNSSMERIDPNRKSPLTKDKIFKEDLSEISNPYNYEIHINTNSNTNPTSPNHPNPTQSKAKSGKKDGKKDRKSKTQDSSKQSKWKKSSSNLQSVNISIIQVQNKININNNIIIKK